MNDTATYDSFAVNLLSEDEALAIVRADSKLLAKLGHSEPASLTGFTKPTYLIAYKEYSMLFQVELVKVGEAEGVYEFHVMCPTVSIRANRVLSLAAIKWIFTLGMPNAKALITNCPEGKIANQCRKFGAKEIKREADMIYFMLPNTSFTTTEA